MKQGPDASRTAPRIDPITRRFIAGAAAIGVAFLLLLLAAPAALGADRIYWTIATESGSVRVGNLDGRSAPRTLFSGELFPASVAIDAAANKIYWASGRAVRVGNLDGTGTPQNLFITDTEGEGPSAIAIDPPTNKIYWTREDLREDGEIWVANLDGTGTPQILFTGESHPESLAIDPAAGRIYWGNYVSDDPDAGLFDSGEIRVANLDGTGSPRTLFTGESGPAGIAIHRGAGRLYWANQLSDSIRFGALDGSGRAQTRYGLERQPAGVAIDAAAGRLYWANFGSGEVRVGTLDGFDSARTLFSGEGRPFFPVLLPVPDRAAKLEITHARVRSGAGAAQRGSARRLVVRGSLSPAAAGDRVAIAFRAHGHRIIIRPTIRPDGSFGATRSLRGPHRRAWAGRLRVRYAGNEALRAASERLRAARRPVRLRLSRAALRGGRLIAAGRVSRRAAGRVRARIKFHRPSGAPAEITARVRVNQRGRFRLGRRVPPAVRDHGARLSLTHPGRGRLHGQRLGRDLGG